MATESAIHPIGHVAELLPVSAAHRVLSILAGDSAPDVSGDATADHLARLISSLGWCGLAPDPLGDSGVREVTARFVRVTFPGIAPPDAFIVAVATAAGLRVESLAPVPPGPPSAPGVIQRRATGDRPSRWLLVGPQSRADLSSAVARLRATHRIHAVPFRRIEDRATRQPEPWSRRSTRPPRSSRSVRA